MKNAEYLTALQDIRQKIEPHLITLGVDELPEGAAFRTHENEGNLKGESQYIDDLDNFLKIEKCVKEEIPHKQMSCYFTYLYPSWYSSSK